MFGSWGVLYFQTFDLDFFYKNAFPVHSVVSSKKVSTIFSKEFFFSFSFLKDSEASFHDFFSHYFKFFQLSLRSRRFRLGIKKSRLSRRAKTYSNYVKQKIEMKLTSFSFFFRLQRRKFLGFISIFFFVLSPFFNRKMFFSNVVKKRITQKYFVFCPLFLDMQRALLLFNESTNRYIVKYYFDFLNYKVRLSCYLYFSEFKLLKIFFTFIRVPQRNWFSYK